MPSTENLKRYKNFIWFLYKYGNSDVFQQGKQMAGPAQKLMQEEITYDPSPEEFVEDLEELGPTFVKLGQLLSTRPDLLPEAYLEALEKLQDDAEEVPIEEIRKMIEEELEVKISKAFDEFQDEPIASASLGQVHMASMRDGKVVVIKVQRPGIREQILEDLEAFDKVINLVEKHTQVGEHFALGETFDHFSRMLLRELDYEQEARHMRVIGRNLESIERIVVPQHIPDYSTSKVLTMEFIKGKKVTKVSPLRKLELDGEELVEVLIEAYIKQIVEDGIMHADPHPGNVHLTDDNRLTLLDFGMVSRVEKQMQEDILQLMNALSSHEASKTAKFLMKISKKSREPDEAQFRSMVGDMMLQAEGADLGDINTGGMLIKLSRAAALNGYLLPPILNIIGKALLNLDKIAYTLAPNMDPDQYMREITMKTMSKKMMNELQPDNIGAYFLEIKSLLAEFPHRMNEITQKLADGEFTMRIDAFEERDVLNGLQKVANRITLGLLIASLVIGAAMLMRVQTDFQIFGYPGLAILCFILAACGGFWLAIHIIFKDEH